MHILEKDIQLGGNLIFVGGSARSGTTLIQNMLDSHPSILGGPEFLHLPEIVNVRNSMYRNVDRGWIDQICTKDSVDARFRTLILDFLIPFLEKHNTELLSEKTPENALVFPELAELLPKARFIFVVRDPRAIVASMFQVGQRARKKGAKVPEYTRNTVEAITYIRRGLNAGFKAVAQAPGRFLVVRYEDVAQHPEAETKKICEFLEVPWDSAMCSPREKTHMGEQAITVKSNEVWYTAAQYNANPHTDSMESWKKILSSQQQLLVSSEFKNDEYLTNLGYDFSQADMKSLDRFIGTVVNSQINLIRRIPRVLKRIRKRVNSNNG